jgi:hypothetical protein
LWLFSREAELLGDWVVSMDLDVLIRHDITPLFAVTESMTFKALAGIASPYNGSLWMVRTGSHPEVWEDFDPQRSPALAFAQQWPNGNHYHGSDQAWMSYKLPGMPTWSEADGVYQFLTSLWLKRGAARLQIPDACRLMFFAGHDKPWGQRLAITHPPLVAAYRQYVRGGVSV